jgi:hypothetical protein
VKKIIQTAFTMGKGLDKALAFFTVNNPRQHQLISDLTSEELGQAHLFDAWDNVEDNTEKLIEMGKQLDQLNSAYPGGLRYVLCL